MSKFRKSSWWRSAGAAALAALLTACGGGGGDDAAADPLAVPVGPSATVPDAAHASAEAYTRFAGRVISDVGGSQSAAPLQMNAASAPASESASPLPID